MDEKNTLVLGGNGFIGSALVRRLVSDGVPVRVVDRSCPNSKNLGDVIDEIEYIEKDFFNEKSLNDSFEGVDNVFHCITSTYPGEANANPVYDVETNIIGAIRLLEVIKPYYKDIKLFFLSSGGAIYGNPTKLPISETHVTNPISSYGISKLAIENYLFMHRALFGLNYVSFRISNPYGETQNPLAGFGMIPTVLYKTLVGETIEVWGDGNNVRDYVCIDDVVDAIMCSSNIDTKYRIYNIGSGEGTSINELLETIRDVTGKAPIVKYMPKRSFDVRKNYLDISRASSEFDWKPKVDIRSGIDRVWKQMLSRYGQGV